MTAEDAEDASAGDTPAQTACEHLAYRVGDGPFDAPRAYCTVVDAFVEPVRADVCNARYDLSPADHCEYYREHEGIEDPWLTGGTAEVETEAEDGDEDEDGDTDPGGRP